jgi:hypothetical protein
MAKAIESLNQVYGSSMFPGEFSVALYSKYQNSSPLVREMGTGGVGRFLTDNYRPWQGYAPCWMLDVFKEGRITFEANWDERTSHVQQLSEFELAQALGLSYSPDAIRLALHINNRDKHSAPSGYHINPGYEAYPYTHTAYVLNFLRYCLSVGLFNGLEEALDFLESPRPSPSVNDIFYKNEKFIPFPHMLPPARARAFIHGRYEGAALTPDHERAIGVLAALRKYIPDLQLVVAVDEFAQEHAGPNAAFRASMIALMPQVDYVTLITTPSYILQEKRVHYNHKPLLNHMSKGIDQFYADYYSSIFNGVKGRFMYLDPHYPPKMKEKRRASAEELNIQLVTHNDPLIWTSKVLYGIGRLDNHMTDPTDVPNQIPVNSQEHLGKYGGDPEQIVFKYACALEEMIIEQYAGGRQQWGERRGIFPIW